MKRRNIRTLRSMSGVTLVELMIAIAIGLVLLVVLSYAFVSNSRTRNEMEKTGRQIENGRYAMQTLIDDITNAGFFGGADITASKDTPGAIVDGVEEQLDYCTVTGVADKAVTEVFLRPALARLTKAEVDALPTQTCFADMKAATDAIVVRRLSTGQKPTTTQVACPSGLTCVQIQQDNLPFFGTGSSMDKKLAGNLEFSAVRVPVMHVYYVDTSNRLRRASITWTGGVPSVATPEVLADGIELLAFTVVGSTVKVELLARNTEGTQGFTDAKTYVFPLPSPNDDYKPADNIKRQYYSAIVNVYNPVN